MLLTFFPLTYSESHTDLPSTIGYCDHIGFDYKERNRYWVSPEKITFEESLPLGVEVYGAYGEGSNYRANLFKSCEYYIDNKTKSPIFFERLFFKSGHNTYIPFSLKYWHGESPTTTTLLNFKNLGQIHTEILGSKVLFLDPRVEALKMLSFTDYIQGQQEKENLRRCLALYKTAGVVGIGSFDKNNITSDIESAFSDILMKRGQHLSGIIEDLIIPNDLPLYLLAKAYKYSEMKQSQILGEGVKNQIIPTLTRRPAVFSQAAPCLYNDRAVQPLVAVINDSRYTDINVTLKVEWGGNSYLMSRIDNLGCQYDVEEFGAVSEYKIDASFRYDLKQVVLRVWFGILAKIGDHVDAYSLHETKDFAYVKIVKTLNEEVVISIHTDADVFAEPILVFYADTAMITFFAIGATPLAEI